MRLVLLASCAGGLGWVLARKKNGASLKRARKTEKVDKYVCAPPISQGGRGENLTSSSPRPTTDRIVFVAAKRLSKKVRGL